MACAVTGLGIVAAPGIGVAKCLQAIKEGRNCISDRPKFLKTKLNLPVGEVGFSQEELKEIAGLPSGCRISRTALLGIIAIKEAMEDADIQADKRTALILGSSVGGMDLTETFFYSYTQDEESGRMTDVLSHDIGGICDIIAGQCGLQGYRTAISTACSSAANAIMFGERLLRHGMADTVIAGGTDALSLFTLNGFNSLKILDGHRCRPLDASRSGLNLGEGAGFLVLQRSEDLTDTGKAYCQIAGSANRNDAHHQTASSEDGEGAFTAMSTALKNASTQPSQVDYINVHGTGTQNNDISESMALKRLFGPEMPALSSTKAFTGHTLAAAGGIEAVLCALSIKKGIIWPNPGFQTAIAETGLIPETIFREGERIDCVLSNSFGFGGNCTSLVFKTL